MQTLLREGPIKHISIWAVGLFFFFFFLKAMDYFLIEPAPGRAAWGSGEQHLGARSRP